MQLVTVFCSAASLIFQIGVYELAEFLTAGTMISGVYLVMKLIVPIPFAYILVLRLKISCKQKKLHFINWMVFGIIITSGIGIFDNIALEVDFSFSGDIVRGFFYLTFLIVACLTMDRISPGKSFDSIIDE